LRSTNPGHVLKSFSKIKSPAPATVLYPPQVHTGHDNIRPHRLRNSRVHDNKKNRNFLAGPIIVSYSRQRLPPYIDMLGSSAIVEYHPPQYEMRSKRNLSRRFGPQAAADFGRSLETDLSRNYHRREVAAPLQLCLKFGRQKVCTPEVWSEGGAFFGRSPKAPNLNRMGRTVRRPEKIGMHPYESLCPIILRRAHQFMCARRHLIFRHMYAPALERKRATTRAASNFRLNRFLIAAWIVATSPQPSHLKQLP